MDIVERLETAPLSIRAIRDAMRDGAKKIRQLRQQLDTVKQQRDRWISAYVGLDIQLARERRRTSNGDGEEHALPKKRKPREKKTPRLTSRGDSRFGSKRTD